MVPLEEGLTAFLAIAFRGDRAFGLGALGVICTAAEEDSWREPAIVLADFLAAVFLTGAALAAGGWRRGKS